MEVLRNISNLRITARDWLKKTRGKFAITGVLTLEQQNRAQEDALKVIEGAEGKVAQTLSTAQQLRHQVSAELKAIADTQKDGPSSLIK